MKSVIPEQGDLTDVFRYKRIPQQKLGEYFKMKYGPDYYSRIGSKGGKKSKGGGFAGMSYEKVAAAGRKGGSVSRRGKSV